MIAGIYGMNFKYMPELEIPWMYPAIMAVMAVLDLYIYLRAAQGRLALRPSRARSGATSSSSQARNATRAGSPRTPRA